MGDELQNGKLFFNAPQVQHPIPPLPAGEGRGEGLF
jgi:hypothetical protein